MADTGAGVQRVDAGDLARGLTLVALLLHPIGGGWLRPAFLVLAAGGLIFPRLLRHGLLWGLLAALAALRVAGDWPLADNHAYLLAFWCLALALSARAPDSPQALATSARLLIGLVFAFAALWKLVLSPDFLSGDFMRFIWIVDERFEGAATVFGDLDVETLAANRAFLAGAPGALVEPAAFVRSTRVATLFTALIEPLVALAFLVPGRALARVRDLLLAIFCATTYAFATIAGFAWLLLAMGIAQCESPGRRIAYLGVAALVLAYREIPWLSWLA